ncbi:MAG: hypothetical protein JW984_04975 [Deltaproteobacteria bacterium]|uniref:Uncharacterized protein n=1 Tax=Candidatus Zymogenus saltonus TaxID=2844893 RepID=A0A9D8KEF8_9DELT|nr:hypothetical protein [Candidatus Zymogenus saltonus]
MRPLRKIITSLLTLLLLISAFFLAGSDSLPILGDVTTASAVVNQGLRIDASPDSITIKPGETAVYDIAVYFEGYTGEVKL